MSETSEAPTTKPATFSGDAPGYWIMVVAVVFGLSPMIISVVGYWFGSNIGNVLHWATFMTAPIGLLIGLGGFIAALVGLAASKPALAGKDTASLPPLQPKLRTSLIVCYLGVTAVVPLCVLVNFYLGAQPASMRVAETLIAVAVPGLLAIWSWWVKTGRSLLQLHRVSRLVIFIWLIALLSFSSLSLLSTPSAIASTTSQLVVTKLTTLFTSLAIIAVPFIAPIIRAIYVRSVRRQELG